MLIGLCDILLCDMQWNVQWFFPINKDAIKSLSYLSGSCDPYNMLIGLCDIYYVTCNGMCNGFFFINKDYKKSCEQKCLFSD